MAPGDTPPFVIAEDGAPKSSSGSETEGQTPTIVWSMATNTTTERVTQRFYIERERSMAYG
jgi:hypothetical protein